MTTAPVLAATAWKDNAHMIADAHRLGYLRDEDRVLDATYGRGNWWKEWRPRDLWTNDIDQDGPADFHFDFRELTPFDDGQFDAVAFDPPYIAQGGRKSSGLGDFLDRYGIDDCPTTALGVQTLINDGLGEMHRVVKPKGIVLVKVKDYVTSGSVWLGTHHTLSHALFLGFKVVDRFEHIGRPGPQPKARPRKDGTVSGQLHARRNLSTLLVLRKGHR